MRQGADEPIVDEFPSWVPNGARNYLAHTETGQSIRAIARLAGCHASTILRQVRRIEGRRDDLLVDEALRRLSQSHLAHFHSDRVFPETQPMTAQPRAHDLTPDDTTIETEARRVLRRLTEPGACLAVAKDMERAVIVRDTSEGRTVRTAVVERSIAEAMALKDWIECVTEGRIARYKITVAGKAALKRLIAEANAERNGQPDPMEIFADQHRDFGVKEIPDPDTPQKRKLRYNLNESPLVTLARRKDKDGTPFLTDDLVSAGERLREDFELAQMGPRVAQNWDLFLTGGGEKGAVNSGSGNSTAEAARQRVTSALTDLGPGLGDVVLRCCCFLEGMEAAEKRMGWSARSGKIVLRIALQRLKRHYNGTESNWSPMIG
jgi:hypothetical protein